LVANGEINQAKIKQLKDAISKLGITDPNTSNLDAKLGGSSLNDIPPTETLKSILEKVEKLGKENNVLKKAVEAHLGKK